MSDLKGFNNVHSVTLSTDIEDGLVEYFDWGLLNKGNYFNVSLGDTSPSGTDLSKLRMTEVASVDDGRVWSGFRQNWVWQSGVTSSPSPIVGTDDAIPGISGVYVDDTFYPTDTVGAYSHFVDHTNGRIIFDTAIPVGSKVQAEYSYKWINVCYAHSVPWIRELQRKTQQPNSTFHSDSAVEWSIPPNGNLQLPAIAVEIVPRRKFKPYGLGGGQWVYTDVLFHCIAENDGVRNKLMDIVSLQNDKVIELFDSNALSASGDFPLGNNGIVNSGAMRYPDLINNHYGGNIKLTNTYTQEMDEIKSNIYSAIVRSTTEGVKRNI